MSKVSKREIAKAVLADAQRFYASSDLDTVRTHDELLRANLFKEISALTYVERILSDATISEQSKTIARKLKDGGFDPYLPNDDKVSMVGLVSGAVFHFTPYRNINLIPEVAQRNRQPILQQFDLFLKEHPKIRRYARYMVVTSGERFKIYHFGDRLKEFNKQLGRYFEMSTKAGIDVILCSIEFTVDEDNTINLHANIVSAPRKALGPTGWCNWLDITRRHFKGQMLHDAGRIKDTKEIIKYVCKFNEIASLSSAWIVEIAHALYKKQLVRPLGLFREFRKELKSKGQKVRFDNQNNRLVRCEVAQRKKPETAEEFAKEEILRDAVEEDKAERAAIASRYLEKEKEPIQNQIICRTLPQSRATLSGEPFIVVMNYTPEPNTRNGRDGLDAIAAKRAFHFRLLADGGLDVGDLSGVGAHSKLDTLTIIPNRFIDEYMRVDHKRRARVNRLLGLFENPTLENVEAALLEALDEHFPGEYHDWSIDVADPVELLENGKKLNAEYQKQTAVGKAMYQEYMFARNDEFFDSANDNNQFEFDELDFIIPY